GRELRAASHAVPYDDVTETVLASLDAERVRRCLGSLTELQRRAVTLAYYGGYTYRQVAALLDVAAGTVSTRMRDGLIRLRDCLGAQRCEPAGPSRTPYPAPTPWTPWTAPTRPGSTGTRPVA